MATIEIPSRFGPEQAAEWIRTWSVSGDQPDLRLACVGSARLEPSGIVLLASGIARRQEHGLRTSLRVDGAGEDVLALLHGVDFFRELGVEPEGDLARSRAPSWVPLRCLADLEIARRQADATRELLERIVPPLPPSTVRAAQFVFEELAANVVQHSNAARTGFGLAVADPASRRLQLAFCDAGIGFLASLGSNPEFAGRIAGHAEAVRLALDKRITRAATGNIGMGLYVLSSLADRIRGDLWIATGDALLVRRTDAEGGRAERFDSTAGWSGAWLCLDAPVPGW